MPHTPDESAIHILWHNATFDVFVVDGPQSILDAQGAQLAQRGYALISQAARSEPYPSQEPKTDAARQKLLQANGQDTIHTVYADLIDSSLAQLQSTFAGPWLRPRILPTTIQHDEQRDIVMSELAQIFASEDSVSYDPQKSTYLHNQHNSTIILTAGGKHKQLYLQPARSTFMVADCSRTRDIATFHAEVRAQASECASRWKFDLMVLDPPWDNRSVKRKRTAYNTMDPYGINDMLARMDLDRLMSTGCIVAVWITNKLSARETVLADGGLFDTCGVEPIEEWIWTKITDRGQPLSDTRGIWRKPYEVLLVGQRQAIGAPRSGREVKRRFMYGVPDLHSRKPCLKQLFKMTGLSGSDCRTLEVFARHLVEDWWSLGNECLKFNEYSHWQQTEVSD